LIRNEEGKKISKSMADAWRYDPLEIISEYGQDPLRFTLLTGSTPGNDMKLALGRVEANRNFANKIWQASRFVLANLGETPADYAPNAALDPAAFADPADRWIISRFHRLTGEVNRLLAAYQLGEAGRQIYDFLWGEYCDWYIEMTKVRLKGEDAEAADAARRALVYVLDGCLRLLHPYMPFVTEAIWQYLPHEGKALIVAAWPEGGALDEDAERRLAEFMELVRSIRNARSEYDVEPGRRIAAIVAAGERAPFLREQAPVLEFLARIDGDRLQIAPALEAAPDKALTLVVEGYTGYLPLADLVDLDRERARLGDELAQIQKDMARAEGLLANANFVSKARPEVVQKERDKLAALGERRAKIAERLAALG
jgi:valyl-tRNA synthetase